MKFIIKTTLLGGFTGAVWFMVFAFVGIIFNGYVLFAVFFPFYWILNFFVDTYYLDFDTIHFLIMVFIPCYPGLIYGLIAGFLFSLFWSRTPEHKRKEYKFLSSLKYRTHPFLSYFLFLGEGSLGIVALSLPLFILHLIIYYVFHVEPLFPLTFVTSLIILVTGILLSAVSAKLVRKCEVYNAIEHKRLSLNEGKKPENSSLLEKIQRITPSIGFTMFLGGMEAVPLAFHMLVAIALLLLFSVLVVLTFLGYSPITR